MMACDGHQLLLFTAMHKNAHAPSYPGQDIVVCNFFAHTKNQPPFFLGHRAGTTLYDTKYCISNNQHTRVFSAQEYQLSVATQTDGDTLQTSPIFPLCTIVPVPHCPLTVPHCAVLALVSLVPGVWRLTCAGAGSASWQHPASSSPARAQQVPTIPSHHLHPPPSPSSLSQPHW